MMLQNLLSRSYVRTAVVLTVLAAGMIVAYSLRVGTWQLERSKNDNTMLFTLESALLFRYARLSIDGGIPSFDSRIEYPRGVNPYRTFSIGGGVILAHIYKLAHEIGFVTCGLEQFHRYAVPLYFVIFSMGAVFFIGITATRRSWIALLMAILYGICIPSVIRSTGQEFMRENFALPVIFWHVALFVYALDRGKLMYYAISGALLAVAWCLWDMTHLYLYALVVFLLVKNISAKQMIALTTPVLCATVFNPYLRHHYAYISVPMLLLYSMICTAPLFRHLARNGNMYHSLRILLLLTITCVIAYISGYGADYSHFGELILAKLRFLNIKPVDPAQLSFDARVLWTPALHSATIMLTVKFFCCILPVAFVSLWCILATVRKRHLSSTEQFVLYSFILFFVLYVFFVRIHVYSVFFGVMMIIFWNRLEKKQLHCIGFCILCVVCLIEYQRTVAHQHSMGRNEDYKSLSSLIQWIQGNTKPEVPILTSFTTAGPIVNYADRPVIVQPKFEKEHTRAIYKEYVYGLFAETEQPLYGLARRHDAEYLVYDKGTSWSKSIYSPAYFVALDIAKEKRTLAAKLEGNFQGLHKFYPVYENARYRVFKIVVAAEIEQAQAYFDKAEQSDTPQEAEALYRRAVELYPGFWQARMKLGTVLFQQGKKSAAFKQWQYGKELFKDA